MNPFLSLTKRLIKCKDSGHMEFGLFGKDDSGRYKSKDIALEAIARMPSIQPAIMQGVF